MLIVVHDNENHVSPGAAIYLGTCGCTCSAQVAIKSGLDYARIFDDGIFQEFDSFLLGFGDADAFLQASSGAFPSTFV